MTAAEAAARQSETTAKTKEEAPAATSTTATKFALSVKEDGKARF